MKCTVSQAWGVEQTQSRASMEIPEGGLIAIAALINTLLWAAIIEMSLWAAGMVIDAGLFVGILGLIFFAAWLVLNLVAGRVGRSEQMDASHHGLRRSRASNRVDFI